MKTGFIVNILFLAALSATLLYLFKTLGLLLSLILFLSLYSYNKGKEDLGALSSSLTYAIAAIYALTSNLGNEVTLLLLVQIALFDSLSSLIPKISEEIEKHDKRHLIHYIKEYAKIIMETLALITITFSILWMPLPKPGFHETTLLVTLLAFSLILLFKLCD